MDDIFDNVFRIRPTTLTTPATSKDIFDDVEEPGIAGSFEGGLKSGALGVLLGYQRGERVAEPSFLESISASAGELVSDLPVMIAGGGLGSVGGEIGSAAGAFAAPTLIKEINREWKSFEKSGKDLNLENFIEHVKKVGIETGKSSLVGAVTGGIGKLMPILNKIPGISKLFANKPVLKGISKGVLELGALTGTSAALEGELPTKEQFAHNALLLGAAKAVGAGIRKGSKVISDISPKVSELVDTAKTKIESFKKSRERSKQHFDKLKDYVAEKDVKNIESQFKWKRSLDSAEIDGKFTPKNREEMMYYRQKTGNPNIKGDTYEALSKRLPDSAKGFVNNAVDKHLKESLKSWNEDLRTKNISPRAALEEIYLPGMYEYSTKAKLKAMKILKTKNPFANQKEFLSYNEAMTEAGLKPKHKDIIELMKNFDSTMNKVKTNLKLLDDVKKLESDTGHRVIVKYPDYKAIREEAFKGGKSIYETVKDEQLNEYRTFKDDSFKQLEKTKENIQTKKEQNIKSARKDTNKKIEDIKEEYNKKKTSIYNTKEIADKKIEVSKEKIKSQKQIRETRDSDIKKANSRYLKSKKSIYANKDITDNASAINKERIALRKEIRDLKRDAVKSIKENSTKLDKTLLPEAKFRNKQAAVLRERNLAEKKIRDLKSEMEKNIKQARSSSNKAVNDVINNNQQELSKQYRKAFNKAKVEADNIFKGEKSLKYNEQLKAYKEAESLGYVPFNDPLLRSTSMVDRAGRKMYSTTETPALVEPEFAKAFQGVFNKEAYKPEPLALKALDNIKDELRFFRVRFSPFHYGALTESAVGSLGLKGLRFPTLAKEGNKLRSNEVFMKKAAESGLKISGTLENYKKGFTLIDRAVDSLSAKIDSPIGKKAMNSLAGGSRYLFETFHPNLKAVTFEDFSNRQVGKLSAKKGRPLSKAETLKVNRDMASLTNDIYGGQQWETQKVFNDPKNLKWLRRAIAYPDWSTSALRQAGSVLGKGIRGDVAREYWLRYGIMFAAAHGFMKWFNSGWKNNDEGKVVFDVNKANKGITEGDPSSWYKFPLPDFDVKIGGTTYNMGRDSQGKKLYAHIGKQMLEVGKWQREPFNSLFGKSNPLIQIAYKQITGGTPFGEKTWTARGKWSEGENKPWDATDPWTLDRAKSRTKELFSDLMPFSVNTLNDRGIAPFLGSGLGVAAVSRGLNAFTAVPHIKKALINNDDKLLARVKTSLLENKVKPSAIKSAITRSRNELKRTGKIK